MEPQESQSDMFDTPVNKYLWMSALSPVKQYDTSVPAAKAYMVENRSDSSGRNTPTVSEQLSSTMLSRSSTSTGVTEYQEFEQTSPPFHKSTPGLKCLFCFVSCGYDSDHVSEWRSHCSQHFQGRQPPNDLECFLCEEFRARSNGDTTAWRQILDHTASRHLNRRNVTRILPPNSIVVFMFQQGLISNTDLNKLGLDWEMVPSANQDFYPRPEEKCFSSRNFNATGQVSQAENHSDISVDHVPNAENNAESNLAEPLSCNGNSFEEDDSSSEEESDEDEYTSDEEEKPDTSYLVESLLNKNLQPALDLKKQRIIKRTLENLAYVLPTTPSSVKSCTGTESSRGSHRSGGARRPSRSGRTGGSAGRATANDEDIPRGDDEEEEDEMPKGGTTKTVPNLNGPKLACPFFQRDPQRYHNFRGCPGPGWDTAHRVKAHIYRRHSRPIQCVRCWKTFSNAEEHMTHQRAEPMCDCMPEAIADGIDKSQEQALRSKKRSASIKTEVDKWNQIYRIIFPDDREIPSPYYIAVPEISRQSPNSDEFANFEEYQRREMPQKMKQKLEEIFSRENALMEESLTLELLGVMQECIAEIVQDYQRLRRSVASTPASAQQENSADKASNLGSSLPKTTESITAEDRLNQMFDVPPPPADFASSTAYRTPSYQGATLNLLPQETLSSSHNSMSNLFSESSTSARLPTASSLTNYSEVPASQDNTRSIRHNPHDMREELLDTSLDLSDVGPLPPQRSFHSTYGIHGARPQELSAANLQSLPFSSVQQGDQSAGASYLPSSSSQMLFQTPFDPRSSEFQSSTFFGNVNSRIAALAGAEPHGWTLPSQQFSVPQFQQIDTMENILFVEQPTFDPNWRSSTMDCANMNDKGSDEGNLANGSDEDSDCLPPRKRRH